MTNSSSPSSNTVGFFERPGILRVGGVGALALAAFLALAGDFFFLALASTTTLALPSAGDLASALRRALPCACASVADRPLRLPPLDVTDDGKLLYGGADNGRVYAWNRDGKITLTLDPGKQ